MNEHRTHLLTWPEGLRVVAVVRDGITHYELSHEDLPTRYCLTLPGAEANASWMRHALEDRKRFWLWRWLP